MQKQGPVKWGYRRPLHVPWLERLAERRLCWSLGWDYQLLSGQAAGRRGGSCAARLLHSSSILRHFQPRISALRIANWSRFGNSVIQLRNALQLARSLSVDLIECAYPHPFFASGSAAGFQFAFNDQRPRQPTLEGSFFLMDAFRLPKNAQSDAYLVRHIIRTLLNFEIAAGDPRVEGEDLVLHFRSGDVFSKNKPPHPAYGQPPLSFYLSAVDREKPRRVWLVFEDELNPCVSASRAALLDRGIEVVSQSGSLAADLRVLLSARRLVASRGTFVRMIAQLSGVIEKAYFFGREEDKELKTLGVKVITVRDEAGGYADVLSMWSASTEQLSLMLSYPATALAFG